MASEANSDKSLREKVATISTLVCVLGEFGIVLGEPHVSLQHVMPVHQWQAGQLYPPANPTFFRWI